MDIVLLKDVERLGAAGAVVAVKPGYARNFLIPSGLAVQATAQRLRMIADTKQRRDQKATRVKAQAETLKRKLESCSVTLKLSLGVDGKPFGAITTHDVVEAILHEGIPIDKHAVHLEQPIKTLGIYDVAVRLHPEVTATVKLRVAKA